MHAREPAAVWGFDDVDVLVDAFRHVLDALDLANLVGVGDGERGGGAEAGLGVAEPLARGGMVVDREGIVFGMEVGEAGGSLLQACKSQA